MVTAHKTHPSQLTWRSWILPSLVVIAALYVLVRLGFWQLDRLDQRQALNARVQAQLDAPPLDLNGTFEASALPGMEYRAATLTGEYDFEHQVVLRNQAHQNLLGVHLLAPLRLARTGQVVLVDRGWVPMEDFEQGQLRQYDQPGQVTVQGVIRRSQDRPAIGRATDPAYQAGQEPLPAFHIANVERIARQVPYPVLPIYVQQTEPAEAATPPYPEVLELQLTEGSHFGYAIQWFSFAAILALGYPIFVRRELRRTKQT